MSHAYTFFFSFCFDVLYLRNISPNKLEEVYNYRSFLGVLFLVRPTNIIWGLIILLYKIEGRGTVKARLIWIKKNIKYLCSTIIIGLLICSLQFIYWKWATGN